MIKIKKELLQQIERSQKQDSKYFATLIERLDPRHKEHIFSLFEGGSNILGMYLSFYHFLDTGSFEEWDVDTYWEKIKECNPEMIVFLASTIKAGHNPFLIMVLIDRIFESAREILSLEEQFNA